MSQVKIQNVGAVRDIVFDLPEDGGGVVVFRGRSSVGKTTAIRALAGLSGSKADLSKLEPSDGCEVGEVSGLGRKVRVGKKNVPTGSSNRPTLTGFDLSTLIDPKFVEKDARMKARMRELIPLADFDCTPEVLLGEQADELLQYIDADDARRLSDPVDMADKLKRQLDAVALEVKRESERKATLAQAKRSEAGDVDELKGSIDRDQVVANHRAAMEKHAELTRAADAYKSAAVNNEKAKALLAELEQSRTGPTLDEARAAADSLESKAVAMRKELELVEQSLANARADLRRAVEHEDGVRRLSKMVIAIAEPIDEAAIEKAKAEEDAAYQAVLNLENVARRKERLSESIVLQNESVAAFEKSEKLRAAAAKVQSEVQKILPEGPIQLVEGDLVVSHQRRGKYVPLDDLSTGEMCSVAVGYAVRACGKGGVIPLRQEIWQALGDDLKESLAKEAEFEGVWIATAEVGFGELRAEKYA